MTGARTTPAGVIAKQPRTRTVSRLTVFVFVWAIAVPLTHGMAPWLISLLSPRSGWETNEPGIWNVFGLVPIALGIAGLVWVMVAASLVSPETIELRAAAFLMTRGPYACSRNPMYLSELLLWIGWSVFYGSLGVLIGFLILCAAVIPGVRYEEGVLEARFGDAYRAYKRVVPRWLGTRRRAEPRTSWSAHYFAARHKPVPSLRGSILRCILRMRKAAIDWNMPVGELRAMQWWSDRLVKPPRDIQITPVVTAGVPAEWFIPDAQLFQGTILYLHGGGWTLGLHNPERRMLARICHAASAPALAVDYRLAPEHPFPAALEDCVAAYRWMSDSGTSPRQIVIVGTSAGGDLALAMLMLLRDAGGSLPAAAVCISPMIDLAGTGDSFRVDRDPAQSAEFALTLARHYAADHNPQLPLLSPLYGDFRGLPPLEVHVGGDEILLSDATRLQERAKAAGVDVTLVIWPKMWHGWHLFAPYVPEAEQMVNHLGASIRERLKHTAGEASRTRGAAAEVPD